MKGFVKEFCKRGLMCGAWGGPMILAIVWLCLHAAGVIDTLTVAEAARGVLTTTVMGFLAAGISVVYEIESLPKGIAALIQAAVLYVDYLGIYLLNGWLPTKAIGTFTMIFVGGFVVIWLCIYIPIRIKVSKMNKVLEK